MESDQQDRHTTFSKIKRPAVSHVANIVFPADFITVERDTTDVTGITPKINELTKFDSPHPKSSFERFSKG